jgi:hypothetical protein
MPGGNTNAMSDYQNSDSDDVIEVQPPRSSLDSGNCKDSGQHEPSDKAEASGNAEAFHNDAVDGNDDDAPARSATERKRGRPSSSVWQWFTENDNPHRLKSAKCKHCKTTVNHHHKSESAQVHLNNCAPFRKLMNGMEGRDRPTFYKGSKKPKAGQSGVAASYAAASSNSKPPTRSQSSIKAYTLPAMSAAEKKQFQRNMALHYYATGTSFSRIEDVHMASAIKMLRPDDIIPNRKKLATTLLDQCYEEVKSKVSVRMKNSTACLITDG